MLCVYAGCKQRLPMHKHKFMHKQRLTMHKQQVMMHNSG